MRKKQRKKEDITLSVRCQGELHCDLSLWIPWDKDEKRPYVNQSRVRLYGTVERPVGFDYPNAVVYVSANEAMPKATERIADIGWVRTQDNNILLQIYWPSNTFAQVIPLVCSGRVLALRATITPIERRTAVVKWLTFETQDKAAHEAEIDYWFVSKPRRRKNDGETQSPLHNEGKHHAD